MAVFKACFDFADKPILEIGYPRNDVLFQKNNEKDIRELKEKLGLPLDKKIMLYAPTWRDNEFYQKGAYKFATELDFEVDQMLLDFPIMADYALIADNGKTLFLTHGTRRYIGAVSPVLGLNTT